MRSSAQQQPAANTPASERFVQQNAGRRRHGPVVAAVQKHDGAESCPGLGAFGVARDLQCGRVLPKTDVNAAAAAARGGGGWGGGGREATHCVKMGAAADNLVHGAVPVASCVNECRGAVSALGVLFQAAGCLVCEMMRYAIDAGDEEEGETRGEEGKGRREAADGAGHEVGAGGVRDDDDVGLGGGRGRGGTGGGGGYEEEGEGGGGGGRARFVADGGRCGTSCCGTKLQLKHEGMRLVGKSGGETYCLDHVLHSSVYVGLRPQRVAGCHDGAGAAHEFAQVSVHAFVPKRPGAAVNEQHHAVTWCAACVVVNVAQTPRAVGVAHVPAGARQLPTNGCASE